MQKQSSLFRDSLGHPTKPLMDMASYSTFSAAVRECSCQGSANTLIVVWFGALYGISPIGAKALATGTPEGQAEVLQRIAWETLTAEPMNGLDV